jgi:hypothetical protein
MHPVTLSSPSHLPPSLSLHRELAALVASIFLAAHARNQAERLKIDSLENRYTKHTADGATAIQRQGQASAFAGVIGGLSHLALTFGGPWSPEANQAAAKAAATFAEHFGAYLTHTFRADEHWHGQKGSHISLKLQDHSSTKGSEGQFEQSAVQLLQLLSSLLSSASRPG